MSEHTPGPWEPKNTETAGVGICGCGRLICVMTVDDDIANTRLIAAAPTMLKALREAKVAMEQSGIADHLEWPYTYKSVVDAIATAEGENEN